MAFSEIYVDPAIAADSGSGTIGDPYGDLEYAIEQETFDTTNGTRVNIKAGTDEVLAADLSTALADTSVSIAWAPVVGAALVFQGYAATAGDGGRGGISGGDAVGIIDSTTLNYIHFRDLHLHSTGTAKFFQVNNYCSAISCELEGYTGTAAAIDVDASFTLMYCHVHSVNDNCLYFGEGGHVVQNVIEVPATSNSYGLLAVGANCSISRNIIIVKGSATNYGMIVYNSDLVEHNSIYCEGLGRGAGILLSSSRSGTNIRNNLVEGFSGTGGRGIDCDASATTLTYFDGNAVYDCTTSYTQPTFVISGNTDNEILTASPFTDAANGDFSPVDTGNVKEGALPQAWNN